MKKAALEYYLGKHGNCAQSVAFALFKHGKANESAMSEMSACGSGRAPDRMCGALYAAIHFTQNPTVASEIQKKFEDATGGFFQCPKIRMAKKLRCEQCVELATSLLAESADMHNSNSCP